MGTASGSAAARGTGVLVRVAIAALVVATLGACTHGAEREGTADMAAYREVPDSSWAALAGKRVFFGHQSVGKDIVDGIGDLLRERPSLGLRIVEGDSAADGGPAFAHAMIGRNGDPGGKTADFQGRIEHGLGGRVDIAVHKYCFVDLTQASDPAAVFARYRDAMARLRSEYPRVTFVHVTTPLVTSKAGGLRLALQRLLGKAPTRVAGNLVRERFNDLLRQEYAGREPVFDLAAVESTRPDGSREAVAFGGRPGYALFPGYSSDGSHLNEAGRRRIAEAFLVFLAGLPASGDPRP